MVPPQDDTCDAQRLVMLEQQLMQRGIIDERVLSAMGLIPREIFVPEPYRENAYADRPLPIGQDQTISQPYIVALMLQLLKTNPAHTVLEIGTGSGYQTALLARMVRRVVTIERIAALSARAGTLLKKLGLTNVHLHVGDGTQGYPEYAPYNGIIVTAGGPRVPDALAQQLADGGTLVCPVGNRDQQELLVIERHGNEFNESVHGGCRFVPLIGKDGWEQ